PFLVTSIFFFSCSADHQDLHSFPTRRSSDLAPDQQLLTPGAEGTIPGVDTRKVPRLRQVFRDRAGDRRRSGVLPVVTLGPTAVTDRKSTRLNSSHVAISYAVFCLKKKNEKAL